MITASNDHTARIYDIEGGRMLSTLSGHEDKLTFCSSHRTNKIVATSSCDFTFRLWDRRETMQSVAVFQGHNAAVNSAVFAAQNYIASSSDDRSVKVCRLVAFFCSQFGVYIRFSVWDLRNMRSPVASVRFTTGVNKLGASTKHNLIACPVDNG